MVPVKNRISSITVSGFKSICAEQSIEIRPLTILAGANSSGKSSFMQPLLLLKQTLDTPGDPGALRLDGPNVFFTSAEQMLSRVKGNKCSKDFTVRIGLLRQEFLEIQFHYEDIKGFQVERMIYNKETEKTEIVLGMPQDDIRRILPEPFKSFDKNFEKTEGGPVQWSVCRDRCFLSFDLVRTAEGPKKRIINFGPYGGISPANAFVSYILDVIHLPGLRGNPQRTYPKASGGPQFPGTFEQYIASVIAQWQSDHSNNLTELAKNLEQMGLTWKVEAKPVDDTQVELKVGRLPHSQRGGAHDLVSIADVGFGVSQSLPALVALLAAHPGQLVYLEQPEIHLHPLAQRRLASVLGSAITRGVVAVVETHSTLLLREIQTLVANGGINRADVKLHWMQRGDDGSTTVTSADMDERGAYGKWPEDFDKTELEAEESYLNAVETKEANL